MLGIKLITVGKLKERYYIDAVGEYQKRLTSYCRLELEQLDETRLPDSPSGREIENALDREARRIIKQIPQGSAVIAMCIEGKSYSSEEFARLLSGFADSGRSRLCFVVGGSYGLSESFKKSADIRLSMSEMTFPHHLARIMLIEQIYRGFMILEGTKYHK